MNILNILKTVIIPANDLRTEEARLEHTTRAVFALIGFNLLVSSIVVLILDLSAEQPAIWPNFLVLGLLGTHLFAWQFIKKGRWKSVRYIPPIIFLTAGAFLTANPELHTTAILQYTLSILLTAILFNATVQWITIAICAVLYLGISMVVDGSVGYIDNAIKYVNVVIFLAVGILQQITLGVISLTINRLTEETESRKKSEESSRQKEYILAAIAHSAQMLLDTHNWERKIQEMLELLGMTSGASHAYLFKNHRDENGILLSSLIYEWGNPAQSCPPSLEQFQNVPLMEPEMIDWYNTMVTGAPYYDSTETFSPEWAKQEGRNNIKTLLDVPIFVDGEWWGVIGFDDCIRVKPWSQAEVDALQIAAGLLGSAIKRQKNRDALSASEDKFQKTFHQTLVPMVIGKISDRTILDANEAFAKLTGYSRPEIINRWASELNLWQNREEHALHHKLIKEHGSIYEFKTNLRKKDGSIGVVLISVSTITIDNEPCLLYSISDITGLEKALTDLQSKNNELERFTYTVSHDLKAPLITIGGFMGLLQKDLRTGNIEKVNNSAQRIMDAVAKMERLLNELLELSRIGRMINEPVKVPFGELVNEAVGLVQGRLRANNINVQVEADLPVVKVDRARMVEVIQNLLDNASKFMGGQPTPEIHIGVRTAYGERVFFVADNGIGIEPVYHKRVFGLFNKLDANTEGTGIGLALVQRIIEFHGGRIWVESDGVGKGTSFCFTLPGIYK